MCAVDFWFGFWGEQKPKYVPKTVCQLVCCFVVVVFLLRFNILLLIFVFFMDSSLSLLVIVGHLLVIV